MRCRGGLIVLLTAAAGIVIVGGIKAFAAPVGPLMLALLIVVVVSPIQGVLTRRGAPSWVALSALLVTSFGILVAIVGSVVWAAAELVGLITGDTGHRTAKLGPDRDHMFHGS